ncbi:MAG: methyltransferase domain-containing protein [Chloroflexota bacterium]|nr:methyltransferase domain-containing protein [Chloroflexota bacterium]
MLMRLRRTLRNAAVFQTLFSIDAYAKWASSYPPHAHNALMRAEESAMRDLMPSLAGRVVLDLASGTGRYGIMARDAGARTVIALDNSPHMLAANPLAWRAGATTEAIPLASASVDIVLCGLALGHLSRLAPSMREIGRVLASGGAALISDIHPYLFLAEVKDQRAPQRTFTASDGKTYAVEHYPHGVESYLRAAEATNLRLDAVREPRSHEAPTTAPVAIVYRFIKANASDA